MCWGQPCSLISTSAFPPYADLDDANFISSNMSITTTALVPMGLMAAYQAKPNTDKRKEALLELMSRSFYSTRGYPSPSLQRYCVTLAATLEESIEKDLRRFNEQHNAYDPFEPDED